ncbi:serine hydrolase domain-containing protein [Paenarthrobacter sp. NPDC089322]|uniref:serine hydrolase domain-containing protein n=1 Tax=Paenarthrobacter sp. NPDC089322 TaxID=3155065 RepID=UPI00341A307E
MFSREMIQQGAPSVLIEARAGRQSWSHAAGARSLDGRVRVQADDVVRLGGLARTMVAVSVLKLVDAGRVRLDDPVAIYVPEAGVPAQAPLTVRQVLGRAPGTSGGGLSDDDILRILLERTRGFPLADVLRTDIVEPLNLRSLVMPEGGPAPANLVHGYAVVDGNTVDVTGSLPSGGVGIIASAADVSTFYASLLGGKLLSQAGLVELKGPVFAEYGLGLDHWHDRCTNGSYYGHAADMPGGALISMSSADGNRQLTIAVASPPAPLSTRPSAIALEITGLAQVALNGSCRFQFR